MRSSADCVNSDFTRGKSEIRPISKPCLIFFTAGGIAGNMVDEQAITAGFVICNEGAS